MISRLHISSFVGLTVLSWLLVLWIDGQPVLSLAFLKPFGIVVSLIVGCSLVFNRWAWAWPIFSGWYVNRPDLRGTWRVRLISDWIDPETEKRVDPQICYLVVRQTLVDLSARLVTAESTSKSIAYCLTEEEQGIYRLAVIYRNEPKIELQGSRSDIHHGSFLVEVTGQNVLEMDGHYWTDRGTRGELKSLGRKNSNFDTFERAQVAFDPQLANNLGKQESFSE